MRRQGFIGWAILVLWASGLSLGAQEYVGITGMIHVPTAEMSDEGTARIGGSFLHKDLVPNRIRYKGEKYNTGTYYLGIAPFSWLEMSYVGTLLKGTKNHEPDRKARYIEKDRHFNGKIRLLKEGKWWPAVAFGAQDPSNPNEGRTYFGNYYGALTKHLNVAQHELAAHLVYRHYHQRQNHRWQGVCGGITYRPAFAPNWRCIVEYTCDNVNVGVDCLLWRHLFLQASLVDGQRFSGVACYRVNLLSKNKRKK